MASIQEVTGPSGKIYRVRVRIKGTRTRSATFNDRDTAEIWADYIHTIDSERKEFSPRDGDLITVGDVMLAKYGNQDKTFSTCKMSFTACNIWDMPLNELTEDLLMQKVNYLLNTPVRRGGNYKSTGNLILPKPVTVLKKLAYLSSAINLMRKKGADLRNETGGVIQKLRDMG